MAGTHGEMRLEGFYAGQEFEFDGVQYRILPGNRCRDDLVLEFRVVGWHRPKIAHTLILCDFKFQVEQNNYGPNGKIQKARGGWYLIDAIKSACHRNGWRVVANRIENERLSRKP